jgi:uncharacterized protein YecT (DUF1311 family)
MLSSISSLLSVMLRLAVLSAVFVGIGHLPISAQAAQLQSDHAPLKTGTKKSARAPQGPSFDCARASHTVERTICVNRGLQIQDREIAALYRQWRLLLRNDVKKLAHARADQEGYLANRKACGRDRHSIQVCIEAAQENRVLRLKELIDEAKL